MRGLYVDILKKPPQSSDINVVDLGYFTSIQSQQQTKKSFTVNQLVENLKQNFDDIPVKKSSENIPGPKIGCNRYN